MDRWRRGVAGGCGDDADDAAGGAAADAGDVSAGAGDFGVARWKAIGGWTRRSNPDFRSGGEGKADRRRAADAKRADLFAGVEQRWQDARQRRVSQAPRLGFAVSGSEADAGRIEGAHR